VHIDDLKDWCIMSENPMYEPLKLRGARGVTRVR
jgi:hypothetical protein